MRAFFLELSIDLYRLIIGTCMVSVEVAGPVLPLSLSIVPDSFISMAGFLFEKCVVPRGTGGFITEGISEMIDYIRSSDYNLHASYRESDTP